MSASRGNVSTPAPSISPASGSTDPAVKQGKEQLGKSRARIQENAITTIAYGHSGKPKLLSYKLEKLVRYGGIFTLFVKGTIFTVDNGVTVEILKQFLICGAICIGVHFQVDDPASLGTTTDGLVSMSKYMNSFVPFVLGLYLSLALSRWWALRVQALGTMFDAIANVSMLVSCVLPSKEHQIVRYMVVKWGMASIQLLLKAARGSDDISNMKENGLLTREEVDSIESCSPYGRAMVMWGWIMRICQDSFHRASGPPPHAPKVALAFNICLSARNGIQTIHTYLQTQLPFAYVHLISLLVSVNNLIVTAKCALVIIVSISKDPMDGTMIGNQLLMMILIPTIYQGLLSISYMIHDPFGEDMLDFPVAAYEMYVQESCNAVMQAQEAFPSHLVEHLKPAPPQEKKDSPVPAPDPDATLVKDSLTAIAGHLELLPRLSRQIETLQDMTCVSEKTRRENAEQIQKLFDAFNQQVQASKVAATKTELREGAGRELSRCVAVCNSGGHNTKAE